MIRLLWLGCCTSTDTHSLTHTLTHTHTHIYIYTHTHTQTDKHTHTHTLTHTFTHTYCFRSVSYAQFLGQRVDDRVTEHDFLGGGVRVDRLDRCVLRMKRKEGLRGLEREMRG